MLEEGTQAHPYFPAGFPNPEGMTWLKFPAQVPGHIGPGSSFFIWEAKKGWSYRFSTTLDREIALKILPPELAENQERLDRFRREAKTLAALNHPNVVHVYTVEEDHGTHFLTMELVEGKPLSERILKGGLPVERIFEIAIPLADALAASHEKGIIHRDLKPANVMVTDEGRVKVLDFGLAKLRPDLDATMDTELPTEPLTGEGRILGTIPYMLVHD